MNLIVQKSIKYNSQEFFNKIINLDYVSGITLNIAATKDNVLVVFNLASGNEVLIDSIYSNTFNQLKNIEMLTLVDVINYLNKIKYSKKVLLNLMPFEKKCTSEKDTKELYEAIQKYALNLENLLKNNTLDLYIHSSSRPLLNEVMRHDIKCKFGFAITRSDLNYIDVNYYIFPFELLDFTLMKQQLDNGKEVMLFVGTGYEMSYVYDYLLGDKKTDLTKAIYEKVMLIGDYPDILAKTFLP